MAGVTAGSSCTKLNSTSTFAGKKFVCVKSNSKLVWSLSSNPSNSNSPTSSSAVFRAKIPIKLPVTQSGPITFSNISSNISSISQTAYQNVQSQIANASPVKPINNEVYSGPNTTLDVVGGLPRIQDILSRDQKLWSGFSQVSNFILLMYNATDEPWAESKWNSIAIASHYFQGQIMGEKKTIAGNCQQTLSPGVFSGNASNCRGADSSAIQGKDDAILTFGQGGTGASGDPYITGGGIVGHEYIHSVQAAQWIGDPSATCTEAHNSPNCFRSRRANNFAPCWLIEGQPNSIGPMVAADTFADYSQFRNQLPYSQGPTSITDYSATSLQNYLFNQKIGDTGCISNGNEYALGYTVGALAVEALVAIDGPQATMALYSLGASGEDFATAFKNVYGISWLDASGILANVLAQEYVAAGPTPQ